MDKFSYALVKCAATVFGARAPVWEIGAYRGEGQEEYGDLREIFPGYEYVGCDMREGPRVDRIEDVTALSAADGAVATLLCLNTLEHVYDIRKGFAEIARVVADGGMAVISLPFYFKVHDYPGDFWRMTPEALERATAPFPWRIIGSRGWETTPTIRALHDVPGRRRPRKALNRQTRQGPDRLSSPVNARVSGQGVLQQYRNPASDPARRIKTRERRISVLCHLTLHMI